MSMSREPFNFIWDIADCGPHRPPQHAPLREIAA